MVTLRSLAFLFYSGLPFWLSQIESPAPSEAVESEGSAVAGTGEPGMLIERLSPLNQIRVFTGLFTVIVLGVVIFIVIEVPALLQIPQAFLDDPDFDWDCSATPIGSGACKLTLANPEDFWTALTMTTISVTETTSLCWIRPR